MLQLDEVRVAFGDRDPAQRSRYVLMDGTIKVIDDVYFNLLTLPAGISPGTENARTARGRDHPPRYRTASAAPGDPWRGGAPAAVALAGAGPRRPAERPRGTRPSNAAANYILLRFAHGTLIVRLGMSGSLRVVPADGPGAPA